MRKLALIIYSVVFTAILLSKPTAKVFAVCPGFYTNPNPVVEGSPMTLTVPAKQFNRSDGSWSVEVYCAGLNDTKSSTPDSDGNLNFNFIGSSCAVSHYNNRHFIVSWNGGQICDDYYTVPQITNQYCNITLSNSSPSVSDTIDVTANNTSTKTLSLRLNPIGWNAGKVTTLIDSIPKGGTGNITIGPFKEGQYEVYMRENGGIHDNLCPVRFTVTTVGGPNGGGKAQTLCDLVDPSKQAECRACTNGVWTAVGCITTDPNNLLGSILRFGLGIAGGIAFLLILFGGLQIMTSAGNPEQLNAGRELITSAIIGLILILFSIFLLQFIGVNIIGIPGFSAG